MQRSRYLAYQAVHAPREVPAAYTNAYAGIIGDKDRQQVLLTNLKPALVDEKTKRNCYQE
eukprot:COSAG01_NODE_21161_length_915_cov_1.415441_2_plen_60_part_00